MPWRRRVLVVGGVCIGVVSGAFIAQRQWERLNRVTWTDTSPPSFSLPTREKQIQNLQEHSPYDILVIGGGATGTGVALDAATRKLKVALVEKDDFAAGTSSRSTKLVHGGVRYLEKAFRNLDIEQYNMVREALHERKNFLKIAPHLSYELPIMIPLYKWWHLPYYWVGAKTYDFLAGKNGLQSSYFISKPSALEHFPHLAKESLKGAIVYHDGAHNDARMNIALALTAASEGADIANHVEVIQLHKDSTGKLCGAKLRDNITGKTWDIQATAIVNATGPFTDSIRKMDNPEIEEIVCPSSGVHIILPDYYSPKHMGLLDAATSDGRVIFFLPWQNSVIAGTTDRATNVTDRPQPSEDEIAFILAEISSYLSPDIQVRRSDVLAAWSGIRPLVRDPSKSSTEGLARNHIVTTSDSGLITIAGGKWTTYRAMAYDTVEHVIKKFDLEPKEPCRTEETLLIGAHAYNPTLKIRLIQQYGMESQIAEHLAQTYGDRAYLVADLAKSTGQHWPVVGRRIRSGYPYIEAEIIYAVRHEMAQTLVDVLARRTRLAFLNVTAASDAIPRIAAIMQKEMKWSDEHRKAQEEDADQFLRTMGFIDINSTRAENLRLYRKTFRSLETDSSGTIKKEQFQQALNFMTLEYDPNQLDEWFEANSINPDEISFNEFVELTESMKYNKHPKTTSQITEESPLLPERSGGGV